MTVREHNILLPLQEIQAFCRRHPIQKLSLFGSVLRDDFSENSDIDFLVELDPQAKIGLFEFLGMQYELEDMIGRKTDLRTLMDFNERSRLRIVHEAETLYARQS
jgi:uncharacterized protein